MAFSYVQLSGDGVTQTFNFSFPYLDKSHVSVKVNGSAVGFTWLTDYSISISPAPANLAIVEIRRTTPKSSVPVDFTDGSIIEEEDLDKMALFNLYCAQEVADGLADAITLNSLGVWDGEGRRATNFADPAAAQDLVTKNWAETSMTSTLALANAALTDFKRRYQGALASSPSTRFDGTPLVTGDLYYDTTVQAMRVWAGASWINAGSVLQATISQPAAPILATAGQTVVPVAGGYDPGFITVFLNGSKIGSPDVATTSGTDIVFSSPLALNDEIEYIAFGAFEVANAVTQAVLASASGSFGVGHIQTGTGAVQTTVQDELRMRWRPEQFGAWQAGVDSGLMINRAIDACYAMGGGIVELKPGRTYSVNPATSPIKLRDGVIIDGVTLETKIVQIGSAVNVNLVQNYTYNPGVRLDRNIGIRNVTLEGVGTNDPLTQDHLAVAGLVFFYGVDGFQIINIKLDKASSNGFGWREAHNGIVDMVEGGSFGANLFAPTSGLNNRITNCNLDFAGLTGALPGECIDIENNSASEISSTFWSNVKAKSFTCVDFFSSVTFAHEAQFVNCVFSGGSPRTFRVVSTNHVRAKNFHIGASCRIGVTSSAATALQIGHVDDIVCDAALANDSGSVGTTRAIELIGPTSTFTFDGVLGGANAFSNGLDATTYGISNSLFLNAKLGHVILAATSANNDFSGCTIGNLTVTSAGSSGNRFRRSTRITGTKSFTGGASWAAQFFEVDSGSFSPTIVGSTSSGAGTYTAQIGSYAVDGDFIDFSGELAWTAHTGTGSIRIDLSALPAVPIAGSRWPFTVITDVSRSDSFMAALLSGGSAIATLNQMGAAGTLTNIPMDTSAGIYFSGRYKFR